MYEIVVEPPWRNYVICKQITVFHPGIEFFSNTHTTLQVIEWMKVKFHGKCIDE